MSEPELRRVDALLQLGRWEAAQQVLVPLAAGDPNSARIACLLARCHHLAQNWPAMLAEAERACALAPNDEWSHRLRSVALRGLARPAEAVAAARESVRLKPQLWQPYVALAEALLARQDTPSRSAARDAARQAFALAPNNDEVRVLAGRVDTALGDLRAARAHYEQVLAVSPEHVVARNNLAVLDLQRSRATAAAGRIQAVVAASPDNPLFVRNAQVAATMWLSRLHTATSGLYLACWLTAATLPHSAVRDALAAAVAAGTVILTVLAYRRLPRGIARMVLRPAVELNSSPRSLARLRRSHLTVMAVAAIQVGVALTMLATTLPLWTSLQLVATAAAVPALIRLVRGWIRAASRVRRRRRGTAA
ncbi:MAG TPA: tetratricopeptide repeat protein [Rugosimonospora sp.]|jgi:tetratricopeptide (TPR) repeat protein